MCKTVKTLKRPTTEHYLRFISQNKTLILGISLNSSDLGLKAQEKSYVWESD